MGTVFAVKKYAIHDGTGIRTTVFFKGCPLACPWCHNPEGMDSEITLVWNADKCIGCGACVDGCAQQSLVFENHILKRDPGACNQCLHCTDICPALAHEAVGRQADVADIMAEIQKDRPFYDTSGGGVTFSGGEPLMQPDFLMALLKACGRAGIHRAVDTSCFTPSRVVLAMADLCELFLVDLKHMDSEMHQQYTGVPNEKIKKNIALLARKGHDIRVRIPLIEGFNTDEQNMRASAGFLASLPGIREIDLLPYHSTAKGKYKKMGLTDSSSRFAPVSTRQVDQCADIFKQHKLKVQVGG
ncbi:MAG TPA: glycyl-radical enzyme activating protein [Desulfotignum sp.]|nr:glycyl-radical enzyme activating protein [Desulfotignum sp.]